VHAGNADERRALGSKVAFNRSAIAQVGDCSAMAARFQGCGDVFKPEWFDSKERPKAKTVVFRYWPEEEDAACSGRARLSSGPKQIKVCANSLWNRF
jgi:hypothetical protein